MTTKIKIKKINKLLNKLFVFNEKKIIRLLLIILLFFIIFFVFMIIMAEKTIEDEMKEITDRLYGSSALEKDIHEMVKGYPIEKMVPYIARNDQEVAAFLVSIAKKESNWGKRSPKLNGKDCYNYWGYRGIRERMGTGGHTCFENPADAVNTVSKRIKELVIDQNLNTPKKMIVWKCGSSCEDHNPSSVKKWISDVKYYFEKLD